MSESLCEPLLALDYRGNSYSRLDSHQQSAIYEKLLRKCHTPDILRLERFLLEGEPLSKSQANALGFEIGKFVAAPRRNPSIERRKVVAIDCLWGRDRKQTLELLAISAVDFLSGETLISSFVAPPKLHVKWVNLDRGVGPAIKAIERGHECLQGWREAREKLFEYVDNETILVGYGTRNHLKALHLFHTQLIDSQILTTSAVLRPTAKRQWHKWSLNEICMDFVGINIGQDAISEDQANWTFENVLASREIVLHCVQRPKDLEDWGKEARRRLWKQLEDKREAKGVKKVKKNDHSAVSPAKQANAIPISDEAVSPAKQANAIPISDEREFSIAYNDGYKAGYQAAYQAGFESGFKTGYKRRYEQASFQADQVVTKNEDQRTSLLQHQQKNHESIQDTDEESHGRGEDASQEDYEDTNQVSTAGSLLAHLMKDAMIEKMIQSVNQTQKETTVANEKEENTIAHVMENVEDARALRTSEEKQEEESTERKLVAWASTNEGVEGGAGSSEDDLWDGTVITWDIGRPCELLV